MINRIFEPKEAPNPSSQSPAPAAEQTGDGSGWPSIAQLAGRNPAAVVAIGLIAGFALGWWVKRK